MSIAEKTIAKITKEEEKLETLIFKRDEYNCKVQAKLSAMNESIKEQETVIEKLRKQEKTEKLEAISSIMESKGITVGDLLDAVENNDLYSIQELIESSGNNSPVPEKKQEEKISENDNPYDNTDYART